MSAESVPMLLWCPSCGRRHIDAGVFAVKEHHTHACQSCGMVWRPAIAHTVGVDFLPGFKDADGAGGDDGNCRWVGPTELEDVLLEVARDATELDCLEKRPARGERCACSNCDLRFRAVVALEVVDRLRRRAQKRKGETKRKEATS